MIKAKNKLTNETLNFTEKDFKAIKTHFPDMYEYVGEVENSPIGEQELIIEVIKPTIKNIVEQSKEIINEFIKIEQPKKRGRSKK